MQSDPVLNAPSEALLDELAQITGPAFALRDPGTQAPYLTEWRDRYKGRSPLVLRPGSTAEVSAILSACNRERVAVVPQSGNTGLVGGQIPHETGTEIVVSLNRLTAIRSVDAEGGLMTLEAGVTLAAAQSAARQAGCLFPLSLASEGSCCIGGNLATNAGGTAVLAYGTARALTAGLEVVLADGRILNGLPAPPKDNTGYDLRDLFIGSEGTLGIITAAALKLFPIPRDTATAFLAVPSMDDLVPLLGLARDAGGARLTAFEFMSNTALAMVLKHGRNISPPTAVAASGYALIEISAAREGEAAAVLEDVLTAAMARGLASDARIASSTAQQAALWRLREQMSEVQKYEGGSIKHDISVPVNRIPEFLNRAAAIVEAIVPGARPVPFGHMGDGNIHYNVSQPIALERTAFLNHWEPLSRAIHDLVVEMGGSISAEHGIGRMKRDELKRLKDPVSLALMRGIKHAFDPNGILNPGKVL